MEKALIREIFLSIQGEGPYIGEEQLFVRFCGCNLNCKYCDTDFIASRSKEYTPDEFVNIINSYNKNLTISLTGGEPLLSAKFLSEVLPKIKQVGHKIYLETNGTLPEQLKKIFPYIDVIAADIKLSSATGENYNQQNIYDFFDIAQGKTLFAKIVFDNSVKEEEILFAAKIAKKYDVELILQPKMDKDNFAASTQEIEDIFFKFKKLYDNVRLIPQMHKFLNIR